MYAKYNIQPMSCIVNISFTRNYIYKLSKYDNKMHGTLLGTGLKQYETNHLIVFQVVILLNKDCKIYAKCRTYRYVICDCIVRKKPILFTT